MKRVLVLVTAAALSPSASGQCREWGDSFALTGAGGAVSDCLVWDDGTSPRLYVAGEFYVIGSALGSTVARYDGTSYEALVGSQGGRDDSTYALVEYDDGSGSSLVAVGSASVSGSNVERWNGSEWASVGGGYVSAFVEVLNDAVMHDGDLYVGGGTWGAGDSAAVGRWDGSAWSEVGGPVFDDLVFSLAVFDDGSGPAVYAAGWFTQPAAYIAKWNGSSWEAVGGGLGGRARDLLVFDDGSGTALYAASDSGVERWNGAAWSTLGSGASGCLALHDDGSGPALHADFWTGLVPDPYQVARWDGSIWTPIGPAFGLYLPGGISGIPILDLCSFDAGAGEGPELYLGGAFYWIGSVYSQNIARWHDGGWEPTRSSNDLSTASKASTVHDDGNGPKLYTQAALGFGSHQVVSWDGQAWTPLAGAFNGDIRDLESYDAGGGPELYAAGRFTAIDGASARAIAHWNGEGWEAVGLGMSGANAVVDALAVFDAGSGPVLVAAGDFLLAGGVSAKRVAAWDGSSWSAFGAGKNKRILAVGAFDLGAGPELFIGGQFNDFVARWDGASWVNLPNGPGYDVLALEAFDDGSGMALYAGGPFMTVGGEVSPRVGRWDSDTGWSAVGAVGNEPDNTVHALRVFDDGTGPALYAGQGGYTTITGASISGVTKALERWRDGVWEEVAAPLLYLFGVDHSDDSTFLSFEVFDDGHGAGPSLFVLGGFDAMGGQASGKVARWETSCPCPPTTYCTSKVNSAGCTPAIGWSGTYPSSSQSGGFFVTASNTLPSKSGLFFYGYAPKASAFQGGWLCVQAPIRRTALQESGGTPPCGGLFSFDFNAHTASGVDPALVPGQMVYGQYWSRDPLSSFQTNRTDAIEFVICP